MTKEEYKELVCTKCINYRDICTKGKIIQNIKDNCIKTRCLNYRKWSNYIDKSFEKADKEIEEYCFERAKRKK